MALLGTGVSPESAGDGPLPPWAYAMLAALLLLIGARPTTAIARITPEQIIINWPPASKNRDQ